MAKYRKKPATVETVDAMRVMNSFTIAVDRGETLKGGPGDWLLRHENGTHSVMSYSEFTETYDCVKMTELTTR